MNFLRNLMLKGGKKKGKGGKCHFWLIALLLLPLSVFGQNHLPASFLAVRAFATGTNTFGVTNISALRTNAGLVHATNVVVTNLAGNVVRSSGLTNSVSTMAIFRDVPLYTDRNGSPIVVPHGYPSVLSATTNFVLSGLTLYIELSSPRGSNAPIGINIAPLWDGENTPTSTADDFNLVIAGGTGHTTLATNLPVWKWPGAEALRVRNVTNQYILGGDAAITNSTYIQKMTVVGFRP